MAATDKRKVFLIISPTEERLNKLCELVAHHYTNPTTYTATNNPIGLQKMSNAMIDVVISDTDLKKGDTLPSVEIMLQENRNPNMAVIIIGNPPKEEKFLDEIVTGKLSFMDEAFSERDFTQSLAAALNFSSQPSHNKTFRLRFLAKGDILLKQGDKGDFIYILKTGELSAFQLHDGEKRILGKIDAGEFVGEMAYINNEPRSASIEALTDAELIEVPVELVNNILFKRPSWSKALIQTLSKRLKNTNKLIADKKAE